jgi:TPR repeat protein
MVGLLLQRAGLALSDGDIIGARLLFERAAAMGSASAATAAGKTYDIDFLLRNGAHGIQADQNSAAAWFRKGAALGDPEARTQLARLTAQKLP